MTNTQTNTETVFKSQLLTDTANMIKAAGYKVFYSVWRHDTSGLGHTYFHFTDGKQIGYCQERYFGGITFSTVHKPCKECGTGFGLEEAGIYNPTIKDAKKAFILAPNWAKISDVEAVRKYADWNEYASKNNSPEYIEY